MSKVLVINYAGLGPGGIEKYLYKLIDYSIDKGIRVVWLTFESAYKNAFYRDTADNPQLEKVFFPAGRRKFLLKNPKLSISENDEVTMISFIPEDYVWAEKFRYDYKCKTFNHFLILMNFFGFLTFPEDFYKSGFLKKRRKEYSKKIAEKLVEGNNIRAFAMKQLEAYKERYNLSIPLSDELLLKAFPPEQPLSYNDLMLKSKNRVDNFVISTCARFAFPHKGYLIGLLDVFSEIKKKYTNIKLVYVGDNNIPEFMEKYNSLPEDIRNSIVFKGQLLPKDLNEVYKNSHLCIGLAGAISTAASLGLPSLVVRHDTYNCETYGFYQDCKTTLCSDPGEDIIPFIEKTISCSDEEFVELGLNAAIFYKSRLNINPNYIFEQNNFVADGVSNGDEAFSYAQTEEYDGLVLDIMMPGMDGITVLQKLRKMNIHTPALFLTARTEVSQRVEGLDAGADDYLPKPFSTAELLARVRAMLRRKDNYMPDILSYCDVALNRSTYQLDYDGKIQSLSGKEYQIMELLMQSPKIIVPTDKFMDHIWGWDSDVDTSVVWVHISNIRKKLLAIEAPLEIRFIRGAGYVLEDKS